MTKKYPKAINWTYYNSKSTKEKEKIVIYFAKNEEVEKEIERLGFIPRLYIGQVPGIIIKTIKGFTKKARKYGLIQSEYRNKYKELEDKYKCCQPLTGLKFNNFIYTTLPYLNYNEIINNKLSDNTYKDFLKEELFYDKDFVIALLDYRPRDAFQNEIKSYQEKNLPAFLKGVKKYNKELYKELLKYEKVKKLDKETSFAGAKAKVKTLEKGFIKLTEKISLSDDYTAYWNGESIELTFKDSKNFNKIIIEPNEDYIVTIIDEDTVGENTVFETKFNF